MSLSAFPAGFLVLARKLTLEEDAATTVEYAVMLGLILLTALGAIGTFGSETGGLWSGILGRLQAVGFMP